MSTRVDALETRERLLGLPKSTTVLLLLFLVTVDGLATLRWLSADAGREINPAMQWLFEQGPAAFIGAKIALAAACALWVLQAPSRYARIAALVGFTIYVPIVVLHVLNGLVILPAM